MRIRFINLFLIIFVIAQTKSEMTEFFGPICDKKGAKNCLIQFKNRLAANECLKQFTCESILNNKKINSSYKVNQGSILLIISILILLPIIYMIDIWNRNKKLELDNEIPYHEIIDI